MQAAQVLFEMKKKSQPHTSMKCHGRARRVVRIVGIERGTKMWALLFEKKGRSFTLGFSTPPGLTNTHCTRIIEHADLKKSING